MKDRGDTVSDMSDKFPILHGLPGNPANYGVAQRVGNCSTHVHDAVGIMIARDADEPWKVIVQMPIGADHWLCLSLDAAAARNLADELYMQAGKAEEAAKEHFNG